MLKILLSTLMRFLITQNKLKMRRFRVEPIEWSIANFFFKKKQTIIHPLPSCVFSTFDTQQTFVTLQ
jgi:hypothetical protein